VDKSFVNDILVIDLLIYLLAKCCTITYTTSPNEAFSQLLLVMTVLTKS